MLCRVAPRMWYVMYIQNLAHTRPSINRSCSCQKSFSGEHLPFFWPSDYCSKSYSSTLYKSPLNSQKWANLLLRETLLLSKLALTLILIKNSDKQLQGWAERKQGRQNPASPWCCCPQAGSLLPMQTFMGPRTRLPAIAQSSIARTRVSCGS